jgi:hypothetical protein
MATRQFSTVFFAFIAGCVSGLLLFWQLGLWSGLLTPAARAADTAPTQATDVASLRAEIERLKTIVPDQAHAMKDVDYHFTNLWFAGKSENWPLADFYWKETLSHLKWALRIIPVRKDNAGREIKLEEILQSIENSPFMKMGDVVKDQDAKKFEPTYRYLVEGCYGCHKSVDKPFLRPRIPERPATTIMSFDPKATWPK